MSESVQVALIGGVVSIVCALIAAYAAAKQASKKTGDGVTATMLESLKTIQADMKTAQAVTDTKIEELTREVREHNNFARRMPVVEEQIKVANHRISDLESKVEK